MFFKSQFLHSLHQKVRIGTRRNILNSNSQKRVTSIAIVLCMLIPSTQSLAVSVLWCRQLSVVFNVKRRKTNNMMSWETCSNWLKAEFVVFRVVYSSADNVEKRRMLNEIVTCCSWKVINVHTIIVNQIVFLCWRLWTEHSKQRQLTTSEKAEKILCSSSIFETKVLLSLWMSCMLPNRSAISSDVKIFGSCFSNSPLNFCKEQLRSAITSLKEKIPEAGDLNFHKTAVRWK